ncbi:MAG: hypothetical protein COB25_001860 [Oceanospirillales bacterium]|nr:hypothetical protein [Oceanospirillales bacterium]
MIDKEMAEKFAQSVEAFSKPIDFDRLVKDGLLIQKGKSYYAPNLHALPEDVSQRIKSATPTKNGVKVTFYKESKSAAKLAHRLKSDPE